jgi:integrase
VFGYLSPDTAKLPWARAIKRAGINPLSFHACRHGFATGLLEKGVNPKTVAKRGGWKSTAHVFETYGHDLSDENITDVLTGTPQAKSVAPNAENKDKSIA